MMSAVMNGTPPDVDDDDDVVPAEDVERRRDLRASAPGLRLVVTAPRAASFEAVEASRRSLFVRAADPDRFRLGDVVDARLEQGGLAAACRLEVIRKEHAPRAGLALRLHSIDPREDSVLQEILGALADRA